MNVIIDKKRSLEILKNLLKIIKKSAEEIPLKTIEKLLGLNSNQFIQFFLENDFKNFIIDWKIKTAKFNSDFKNELQRKIDEWKIRESLKQLIFISYATEDQHEADLIYENIKEDGFGCWLATRDINYSADWVKEIVKNLKKSWLVVLIISKASNESQYVNDEVRLAKKENIPFFPIKIEDVSNTSEWFELFIEGHQIFETSKPLSNRFFEKLSMSLHKAFKSTFNQERQKEFQENRIKENIKYERINLMKNSIVDQQSEVKKIVGIRMFDSTNYFLDREIYLEKIHSSLNKEGIKVISIIGRGGIGKTALVSKILQDIEDLSSIGKKKSKKVKIKNKEK